MTRYTLQNHKGQRIVLIYEAAPQARGLAFIQHGFSGFKEEPHIAAMAEVFLEHGISAVRFDATNSFGESDGNISEATLTRHAEDLEDVIAWAPSQSWYQEPFYLAGHSLGGASCLLYASRHPEKVKALAPISTIISGKLREEIYLQTEPEEYIAWKQDSVLIFDKPQGRVVRPWSSMEDLFRYDLLTEAHRLTMPVLMAVGSEDEPTPPRHQKLLYDALPGPKAFHVIQGAVHTFQKPEHLAELKNVFGKWLQTLKETP